MNRRLIRYVLGLVCVMEGIFMLLPVVCALLYGEMHIVQIYLLCAGICCAAGALLLYRIPLWGRHMSASKMHTSEGMIAVALSWIVLSLLGALPFWLSGEIPSYIDAFFETVSGFTTTGSTILQDVGMISYGSRFWRSFTHWIGGMGVLVFLLAILPGMGASFMNLMMAESPGYDVSKMVPKVRETAKYLYKIYLGMTLLELVLLLFAGMELFDAITLTMGTAGTGGFAVRSDGFESYTMLQTGIIAVFMMLFGINFNFYFLLLRRRFSQAFRMEEVLTYTGIIAVVTLIIACIVQSAFPDFFQALHHSFFTVSSIITTTGYATVDFALWPMLPQMLLLLLMFIGACAGSTGGGIKVGRTNILLKGIRKEFQTLVHPRSVRKVRMDGRPIAHNTVRSTNVFLSIYTLVFVGALLLITLDNQDFVTSFSAVAATLNNIGPGLGNVGPMSNFAAFSPLSKIVLSFAMLAGRLELLPMLLIFVPSLWMSRKSRMRPAEVLHASRQARRTQSGEYASRPEPQDLAQEKP